MYNILNQNKNVSTGKITWNKVYNITDEDWDHINLFPFNITKYPAMICFQVTINHNILVTNKLLYQMKMRTDALCTLCQANNETITLLLWKCDKFITDLLQWLSNYNIHLDISEEVFIFGFQKEQELPKPLHFILLYAKYFIYLSRCKKQPLNLNVFKIKVNV